MPALLPAAKCKIPSPDSQRKSLNQRIHRFPLNDPETLYSKDVIDFARQQGYFTGKDEDFDFSRAYAIYDMGALRGCDGRI